MSEYSFVRITGDADRDGDFLDPDDLLPGEWMPVRGASVVAAILRCPVCLRPMSLIKGDGTEGHRIDDDGVITPQVICPTPLCPFYVNGKLLDWKSDSFVAR